MHTLSYIYRHIHVCIHICIHSYEYTYTHLYMEIFTHKQTLTHVKMYICNGMDIEILRLVLNLT